MKKNDPTPLVHLLARNGYRVDLQGAAEDGLLHFAVVPADVDVGDPAVAGYARTVREALTTSARALGLITEVSPAP